MRSTHRPCPRPSHHPSHRLAPRAGPPPHGPRPGGGRYAYFDPKLAAAAADPATSSRARHPFTHAIVFVVGPGNYLEYQTLNQAAQAAPSTAAGGRKVTYGCTEGQTPTEFVAQLASLGGQ